MRHRYAIDSKQGFTLVELLVVIGIIAVLISILLPVLGKSRDAANSVACLSNLRQVGIAYLSYANDNRGQVLPLGIEIGGQSPNEFWPVLLTSGKYLPRQSINTAADGPYVKTALVCPSTSYFGFISGGEVKDGIVRYSSVMVDPGKLWADSSYGFNGMFANGNPAWTPYVVPWPGAKQYPSYGIRIGRGQLTIPNRKITKLRKSSMLVLLFDGIGNTAPQNVQGNPEIIAGRHNRLRYVNVMMVDGHAEAVERKNLPGGGKAPGREGILFTYDTGEELSKVYPYPLWRVDQ